MKKNSKSTTLSNYKKTMIVGHIYIPTAAPIRSGVMAVTLCLSAIISSMIASILSKPCRRRSTLRFITKKSRQKWIGTTWRDPMKYERLQRYPLSVTRPIKTINIFCNIRMISLRRQRKNYILITSLVMFQGWNIS